MNLGRGLIASALSLGVASGLAACGGDSETASASSAQPADLPTIVAADALCGTLDAKELSGAIGTEISVAKATEGRCLFGSATEAVNGYVSLVKTTDTADAYLKLAASGGPVTPVQGLPNSGSTASGSIAWAAMGVNGGILAVSLTGDDVTAVTAGDTLKVAYNAAKS